jgi:hypothetical protein
MTERTPAPTDDAGDELYDTAERRAGAAHAANLTAQTAAGGLRFAASGRAGGGCRPAAHEW